jgi:ribosomal subunit interface protein
MQIGIRFQNAPVSDALVAHCQERARRELRPFSARISRVQLVLADLNGLKQGGGHACRATVDILGGVRVRYEGRADDYYQAVSKTTAGLAHHVQRALERRRRHHAEQRPSTMPPAA